MQLVVTIDTEGDDQWDHGAPIQVRNVEFWQPFQSICADHGVKVTYLITSEVANDDRAAGLLRAWSDEGAVEVGSHLHPWTTSPYADQPGLRHNDPAHTFPHQLPRELLEAKLEALTAEVEEAVGRRPTSFRAGRFGFDLVSAQCLSRLGYVVDSSVTPGVSWAGTPGLPGGGGGPDFTRHTAAPFWIADSGDPKLLEVPVTILSTYPGLQSHPGLLRFHASRPMRLTRRLTRGVWPRPQPLWLRPTVPTGMSLRLWQRERAKEVRVTTQPVILKDMMAVWREAERRKLPAAVMMFHSSELMPGGSPFFPDRQSIADLLKCLDRFFAFFGRRGGRSATLSQAASRIRALPDVPVRPL